MTESRAAIFEGTEGRLRIRRLPLPTPRGAEVLVRVLGCTLCGSDLHTFEGRRAVPVPTVLGHEIVGEIVAAGKSAPQRDLAGQPLRVGDRVTWAIVAHCGSCFFCNNDLPQKCIDGVKYGHEKSLPGRELLGGLAEHCLLVEGAAIVRLPADMPLEVACPASCATATVAAALEASGDVRGRTVGIFGAGMLGLTACAMLQTRGAGAIVCVEPDRERRALARAFGATKVQGLEDVASDPDLGHGFDLVLELSGSPAAFVTAWPRLRVGGTIVMVGSVFPAAPVSIALEQIVRRHLTIRGTHNYAPRHLLEAVAFLTANQDAYPFADLVGAWYPLGSAAQAFAEARESRAVRIGVRPDIHRSAKRPTGTRD